MSYCINPNCSNPSGPKNVSANTCCSCGSKLLLQQRYRVAKQLGVGGFGKTYLVEDTLTANKGKRGTPKVLKVLCKNIPIAINLFQREAKVLSQLKHPGIPRVDGECFKYRPASSIEPLHCFVMEFIQGLDLYTWLKLRGNPPQPITQQRAIQWLFQLVDILNELHNNASQQCFHRDIKPANIMHRPNGQLVLIDFGAVREITPTLLIKAGIGQPLTGVCSPGYAPPEQIEGRALPQSDFFALGRTMVHLLTGKHPLHLPVDVDTGNLIWRKYAPTLTESFADFIDVLMAPLPGKRPAHTSIIQQRLEQIQQAKPQNFAIQTPEKENLSHLCEEISVQSPTQPSLPPSQSAIIETVLSHKELDFKKQFKAIMFPGGFVLAIVLGFMGFQLGTSRMAVVYHERGMTHQIANQLYLAQVDFKRAITLNPNYPEAYFHLGLNYELLGDIEQARLAYEKAKQSQLPEAYSSLARLDILNQHYSKAVPLLEKGLTLTQQDTVRYALLKNLGWAYLGQNRFHQATDYLQQAIELNREKASAYCLLAQVQDAQGNNIHALNSWKSCRRYGSRLHPDESKWLQKAEKRLRVAGKRQ